MKNCLILCSSDVINSYGVFNKNSTKDKEGPIPERALSEFTSLFTPPLHLLTSKKQRQMQRITIYVKWREIKKFPGYFVSNTGLVRKGNGFINPRVCKKNGGYHFVPLRSKETFHQENLHHLVWNHFGDTPKQKGYEIHHIDLNILNNHIDNLQYLPKAQHLLLHDRIPVKSLL